MAKNYIQMGEAIDTIAPYGVSSGGGFKIGSLFGVAQAPALSGEEVVMAVTGVWRLAKVSAQAWTVGQPVYWDDTARLVTSTASSNLPIGHVLEVAANPSPTGVVRLSI